MSWRVSAIPYKNMYGIVFDIKEFSLHDGPGIRTTVFLKGCPLRCVWCHNPEGLSPQPELFAASGCRNCGLCRRCCDHEDCRPYGRCLHICPQGLLRVAGKRWEARELADHLLTQADFFNQNGGGITLSGGEPLYQADFCVELLTYLHGRVHCAVETSGFADAETFSRVVSLCDLVLMDLKLADPDAHSLYTGVDNARILANAAYLRSSATPHVFRTPLIPGITDTQDNLNAIRRIVGGSAWETLPYNELASAKYAGVGRTFRYRKR